MHSCSYRRPYTMTHVYRFFISSNSGLDVFKVAPGFNWIPACIRNPASVGEPASIGTSHLDFRLILETHLIFESWDLASIRSFTVYKLNKYIKFKVNVYNTYVFLWNCYKRCVITCFTLTERLSFVHCSPKSPHSPAGELITHSGSADIHSQVWNRSWC